MLRTPEAAVAIGCATTCSTGAAASATAMRKRSNSRISALPSTMNMADRKIRNGTAARWAAALNGAVNRSTVPERSLKPCAPPAEPGSAPLTRPASPRPSPLPGAEREGPAQREGEVGVDHPARCLNQILNLKLHRRSALVHAD